ncbi:MAG: hypothetical protein ACI9JZ_002831 [Lentimonas sp.]|jgi:hypothetical protein
MKKLLILSMLAVTASLAHAGSCGDKCGTDKKGEKSGLTQSPMTLACDKTCDGDKKKDMEKPGFNESSMTLACDKTCDGDKKKDGKQTHSTVFQAAA